MSEARKPFLLRINARLWRELEAWAQEEFRSVNGQIEFLLRDAVRRRRGQKPAAEEPANPPATAESTPSSAEPEPPLDGGLEMGRHD